MLVVWALLLDKPAMTQVADRYGNSKNSRAAELPNLVRKGNAPLAQTAVIPVQPVLLGAGDDVRTL